MWQNIKLYNNFRVKYIFMPGLLDISVICSYSYVNTFFCVGVSFAVSINRCFINKVLFFLFVLFLFFFFRNKQRTLFVGGTTWNFVAAVRKWEMLAATWVKMSDGGKIAYKNKNTYDISSIKRVTRKLLEISHFSRAIKQRQRNVQRKCVARAKFLFC